MRHDTGGRGCAPVIMHGRYQCLPPVAVPPYRSLSIQPSDKTAGSAKHFNLVPRKYTWWNVGKEKKEKEKEKEEIAQDVNIESRKNIV